MGGKARTLFLVGLIVFGFALRIPTIRVDLPDAPHVDEPMFVDRALVMVAAGSWNPLWFGHPGSTMIVPLGITFRIHHALTGNGHWLGADPTIEQAFVANPTLYYLIGRGFSIAYGTLALLFVYLLVRRVFDATCGLVAAALLAGAPLLIDYAPVARTDGASLFFGALALYASLRAWDEPATKTRALAGAALGLAIATKYYFAVFGWILFVAGVRDLWRARGAWKAFVPSVAAVATTAAAFLLLTPYFLLDFASVRQSFRSEAEPGPLSPYAASTLKALWWYLAHGLPNTLGLVQTATLAVGVLLVLRKRDAKPRFLLATLALFLVSISVVALTLERWLIAVLPVCAALIAHAIVTSVRFFGKRLSPGRQGVAIALLTLLIAAPAFHDTLVDIRRLREPSSRRLARQWMFEHVPSGAHIVWEHDGDGWFASTLLWDEPNPRTVVHSGLTYYVDVEPFVSESQKGLAGLRCDGFTHLMLNQTRSNRRISRGSTSEAELRSRLAKQAKLLTTIDGQDRIDRDGPSIAIYDISAIPCLVAP